MNFDLEKAVEQIKNNKNFLKLRNVIENNAYHNHESVFDHLVKTYEIAKREIKASFITNEEAKRSFEDYINQEIGGIKKKDLMLIFALIHDIGKVIVFEENGKKTSIVVTQPEGTTLAPGHEYWGSLIVEDMTKEAGFSKEILLYLSKCVRLHGSFNTQWMPHQDLGASELLPLLKLHCENIHVEQIFNGYCDCYTAAPFQGAIPIIHELLNNPDTYKSVKYYIVS